MSKMTKQEALVLGRAALVAKAARVDPREYIREKSEPEPNSGCWLYLGFMNEHGYGRVHMHGRYHSIHRLSYSTFNGVIPSGYDVRRTCGVTACVNPAHLEAVAADTSARERSGRTRDEAILKFWSYVQKTDGCWLWTGFAAPRRYGAFRLEPRKPMVRAHRLSWELTNGPIAPGLVVCHHCDNPACVNPSHLFIGNQRDNMRDCSMKGRMPRGQQRHAAKLTPEAVRCIRRLLDAGRSQRSIAKEYGVSNRAVIDIISGKSWRWVA